MFATLAGHRERICHGFAKSQLVGERTPPNSPSKNPALCSSRGNEAQISRETETMSEPPHVGCYILNGLLTKTTKYLLLPGSVRDFAQMQLSWVNDDVFDTLAFPGVGRVHKSVAGLNHRRVRELQV